MNPGVFNPGMTWFSTCTRIKLSGISPRKKEVRVQIDILTLQIDKWIEIYAMQDRCMDGKAGIQLDRQKDKHTDRQTSRLSQLTTTTTTTRTVFILSNLSLHKW